MTSAPAEKALGASPFWDKTAPASSLDIFRNLVDRGICPRRPSKDLLWTPVKSRCPGRSSGYGYPRWILEPAKKIWTVTVGKLLTLLKISRREKRYSSSGQHQAWSNLQSHLIAIWDTKRKWSDRLAHRSPKTQFPRYANAAHHYANITWLWYTDIESNYIYIGWKWAASNWKGHRV